MKVKVCMPLVALRGLTILPNVMVHFDVSRSESLAAVKLSMASDQYLYVVTQLDKDNSQGLTCADLEKVGCVVKVQQMIKLSKNIVRVVVEGICRAELLSMECTEGFYLAEIEMWSDREFSEEENEAYCKGLMEEAYLCHYSGMNVNISLLNKLGKIKQADELVDNLAEKLPFPNENRQLILNIEDTEERIKEMLKMLHREAIVAKIRAEFQLELKNVVEKNQKEYVLREQQKLIQEELGDTANADIEEYKAKLLKLHASEEVTEKISREIKHLEGLSMSSSESAVSRTYIETLLDYPWSKATKDNQDIKQAEQILERDHYGLDKIKERILEFLAVRSMVPKGNSPILCLVGPPGTGKTSIAQSIATAMNKPYVRISLGGIRDEAEIRGHRKTYVGAMPGRIATAMIKAGVNNPLLLLDEIDKMSNDYKGDPSSAMLEVLDAEQNYRFVDHYFEVPIDLSQVTFIATANDISNIPKPLKDRLEIIEISSYTQNEKFHIAKEFLVKKQRKRHGLQARQFQITDEAIHAIITGYTREAGVRSLERQIASLCRKTDRLLASGEKKTCKITQKNLEEYLGIPKYEWEDCDLEPKIGSVTGLAWTSVGGGTLQIEVSLLPGDGAVKLTGNLGDVMKESAQLAVTYVKSRVAKNLWKDKDIHIHVPEGAVPKDGPSAGITMATAVYSAVRKLKVRGDLAMTGEVTLRGQVLPIGGLKEKLLAARNCGIQEVLVPVRNRKDVAELSEEITDGLRITYVSTMDDVLKAAMVS